MLSRLILAIAVAVFVAGAPARLASMLATYARRARTKRRGRGQSIS
jgi:hypothetical protein